MARNTRKLFRTSEPFSNYDPIAPPSNPHLSRAQAMYACIPDMGGGFFARVCTPGNATANIGDPPRDTKEPESPCQDSGPKWITRRATVDGALAWGRGKPPLAQCPSTARKPPKRHAPCHTHVPRSIASRYALRRNTLSWQPRRSRQEFVNFSHIPSIAVSECCRPLQKPLI
jgi:hypothetical protein